MIPAFMLVIWLLIMRSLFSSAATRSCSRAMRASLSLAAARAESRPRATPRALRTDVAMEERTDCRTGGARLCGRRRVMTSSVGSWTASMALGLLVGVGEEEEGTVAVEGVVAAVAAVVVVVEGGLLGVSGASSKDTVLWRLLERDAVLGKRVRAVEGVGRPVRLSMAREEVDGVFGLVVLGGLEFDAVVSARAAICLSSSESSWPKESSPLLSFDRASHFLLDPVGHGVSATDFPLEGRR